MGTGDQLRFLTKASQRALAERGVAGTTRLAAGYLARRAGLFETDLTQTRFRLSERLAEQLDYTVAYGPFTGLRLSRESWWSAADHGAMLLGLYEAEVLDALASMPADQDVLIDIGAADGYYAIGALTSGLVRHAYCFEANPEGQEVIMTNATLNGVADRVTVLGTADSRFLDALNDVHPMDPQRCRILIDIEGGEFELLTADVLEALHGASMIVELHEMGFHQASDGEALRRRVPKEAETSIIRTSSRDPGAFPELSQWNDDERWLLCSEGRANLMRWLCVTLPRRDRNERASMYN